MPPKTPPLPVRRFGRIELARMAIFFVAGGSIFAATYFLMPVVQSLIIPSMPGGANGPWVIRPIVAFHFCACAILTAVLAANFMGPLRRKWLAEDVARGSRFDPYHGRPVAKAGHYVKGILLLLIYGVSLVFYLLSWQIVGPAGIEEHLPWGVRKHSYDQVVKMDTIPEGWRSESLEKDGPWASIDFQDGRSIDFSPANEGLSAEQLETIEAYIAAKTGRAWQVREDARAER